MIQKCLFSVDEFMRMIDAGIFVGRTGQIELIEGELIAMTPASAEHSDVIAWLTRWSAQNTDPAEFDVRVQCSIGVPELQSVPEPDVAWVRKGDFRHSYPKASDVALLIEVCVSSGNYDRGRKAKLYAEAGISDYWVVDVVHASIDVMREPNQDGYSKVTAYREGQTISPLCQPLTILVIDELFPKE